MRILIIEDDLRLSDNLQELLSRHGYAADLARDGADGEEMGNTNKYDAVVLDLGLPGRPGLAVLKNWRAGGNATPVIILTARDAWSERVEGFKAGADDYLGKPFHAEELLARLNAVLRRAKNVPPVQLAGGRFALDEEKQSVVFKNGRAAQLTGVEFRILRYLMLNRGRIVSKGELEEHVYDMDASQESNVLEVYVSRLREIIGKDQIATRRGQGYVFTEGK